MTSVPVLALVGLVSLAAPGAGTMAVAVSPVTDTAVVRVGAAGAGVDAFVAWPARRKGAATIVVVPESAADAPEREIARRLAREGYVAIVPAPDAGTGDAEADDARSLARIETAVAWARRQPEIRVARVGAIGFGSAAARVERYAVKTPGLAAVVLFYGPVDADPAVSAGLKIPVQVHLGATDPAATGQVEMLRRRPIGAGPPGNVHVYAGARRAFLNERGEDFHADAARQSWARTLAFLQKHLRD